MVAPGPRRSEEDRVDRRGSLSGSRVGVVRGGDLPDASSGPAPAGRFIASGTRAAHRTASSSIIRASTEPSTLVPGNRMTLRRWLESGEGPASGRRRLASLALALPEADRLATSLLPSVGIAACRPEAPAPFQWLSRLSGARVVHGLVRAKWRAERGGAVVTGLDEAGRSVVVAKIALGGPEAESRAAGEADRLEQLGPAARKAGAQLPSPLRAELPGGWPILLLSPLAGTSRRATPRVETPGSRSGHRAARRVARALARGHRETRQAGPALGRVRAARSRHPTRRGPAGHRRVSALAS